MAKRSTNWITEMADVMRANGVVMATRRTTTRDGRPDEYELVLSEKQVQIVDTSVPPVNTLSPEEQKDLQIRQQYFDLFGRFPNSDELKIYREMPTLLG